MSTLTLEFLADKAAAVAAKPTFFELSGQPIRPCPFCGGSEITVSTWEDVFFCRCMMCQAAGPERLERSWAIAMWQKQTILE